MPKFEEPFAKRGDAEGKLFSVSFPLSSSYPDAVQDLKRWLIEEALNACNGNKMAAARLLGMTRHALRRQIMSARLIASQ